MSDMHPVTSLYENCDILMGLDDTIKADDATVGTNGNTVLHGQSVALSMHIALHERIERVT
jgi:hypothetical protein